MLSPSFSSQSWGSEWFFLLSWKKKGKKREYEISGKCLMSSSQKMVSWIFRQGEKHTRFLSLATRQQFDPKQKHPNLHILYVMQQNHPSLVQIQSLFFIGVLLNHYGKSSVPWECITTPSLLCHGDATFWFLTRGPPWSFPLWLLQLIQRPLQAKKGKILLYYRTITLFFPLATYAPLLDIQYNEGTVFIFTVLLSNFTIKLFQLPILAAHMWDVPLLQIYCIQIGFSIIFLKHQSPLLDHFFLYNYYVWSPS